MPKTHLWFAAIASTTGTATLIFSLDSKLKVALFSLGVLLSIVFISGYFKRNDEIDNLMNKAIKEDTK